MIVRLVIISAVALGAVVGYQVITKSDGSENVFAQNTSQPTILSAISGGNKGTNRLAMGDDDYQGTQSDLKEETQEQYDNVKDMNSDGATNNQMDSGSGDYNNNGDVNKKPEDMSNQDDNSGDTGDEGDEGDEGDDSSMD